MSHSYGNGNSNGNNYIGRKRAEDDIPMENKYHHDKFEKFGKYGNHERYNNMGYTHSKPFQGNNYNNTSSRYRGNYYNNPKSFHSNNYSNKLGPKRDYKKPYKYSNSNTIEGIRNLSHCEMPSPPPLSIKQKQDGDSLKSISSSTTGDSKSSSLRPLGSNNGINLKGINNFVSKINGMQTGRGQPIFNQQNINIAIKLTSSSNLKYKEYKGESKKWKKEEEDEDIPIFKYPKPPEKLLNYEPFNRNSIKIEEDPFENFEIYPKNLYEINMSNYSRRFNNGTIRDTINNDNIENALSLNSCYLLAKIRNWRLVTNFVPASSLTEEKFKNIIPLDEEKEENGRKEKEKGGQNNAKKEETTQKKEEPKKSYLVYSEKFEEVVDKSLEQIMHKKRQVKKDIFNKKYIIAQFHYDILKLKNKLKQNICKVNYLNIKQENLKNVLDENCKE